MARHSHWHQIRLKKGVADAKRGKIFTRHARLIEQTARQGGGDEGMNPNLRLAIENARADNMPRENIDRAIKKGTGELKADQQLTEALYEGFGPGGVAFVIEVLTDNKNRANQMIRKILESHGGSLGSSGATSFLFEKKGEIVVRGRGEAPASAYDKDELDLIDSGAEDLQTVEGGYVVYTAINGLAGASKKIREKGFIVKSSGLTFVPRTTVVIEDAGTLEKLFNLMEELDNEDDVTQVAANFEAGSPKA